MAKLCAPIDCTSCMACHNACPFNAISIYQDEYGTRLPAIDHNLCRECGLCEKVCPIISGITLNLPRKTIACYTRNVNDRQSCASGGAATTLARYIISKNGVVYGATSVGNYPKFIKATTEHELEALKGSKYVYCDPQLIYRDVKADLVSQKSVLFIGLPCNIAGLKNYLRRDYSNLITVDLVCHGTPPYKYLKQHLASKIDIKQCHNVTFRGKYDFHLTVFDSNDNILYQKNQLEDEYFVAFMSGFAFRRSCYQCVFARKERVADITVADFWGIQAGALDGYKGKISLVLLNTQMGELYFNEISSKLIWENRNIEEAVNGNVQLRKPSENSESANIFRATFAKTNDFRNAISASGINKIIYKNKARRIALFIPKLIISLFR